MQLSLKVSVNVVAAGIISSIPAAKVLKGPMSCTSTAAADGAVQVPWLLL